jgi:hypothetical protein
VAKRRETGVGVNALFPPTETAATAPKKQTRTKTKRASAKKKSRASNSTVAKVVVPEQIPERRTAWLREDHLERLEVLKIRERSRLKSQGRRASITTLIDEAMERYLTHMKA